MANSNFKRINLGLCDQTVGEMNYRKLNKVLKLCLRLSSGMFHLEKFHTFGILPDVFPVKTVLRVHYDHCLKCRMCEIWRGHLPNSSELDSDR